MPTMPREEAKIIVRPCDGLNIARTEATIIMMAVITAAGMTKEEARADTICSNTTQNIIIVSTSEERRAALYNTMKNLVVGGIIHEVWTYRGDTEGTVKGVIKGWTSWTLPRTSRTL